MATFVLITFVLNNFCSNNFCPNNFCFKNTFQSNDYTSNNFYIINFFPTNFVATNFFSNNFWSNIFCSNYFCLNIFSSNYYCSNTYGRTISNKSLIRTKFKIPLCKNVFYNLKVINNPNESFRNWNVTFWPEAYFIKLFTIQFHSKLECLWGRCSTTVLPLLVP